MIKQFIERHMLQKMCNVLFLAHIPLYLNTKIV